MTAAKSDRNAPVPRTVAVYLQPPPPEQVAGRTLVVIDTLRATTAIVTLIAGGAAAVHPAATIAEARALHAALPGSRLCGERGGLPADGFDYGNSPVEFAALDVTGWTVVHATSNGTPALALAAAAQGALVCCLRNRAAVAATLAAGAGDTAVVCAGEAEAGGPSVEDTFTAGALVYRLTEGRPGFTLSAGARLARRVYLGYDRDPRRAFAESPHAEHLRALGFDADITFAAALDVERCVPVAKADAAGRVTVSA